MRFFRGISVPAADAGVTVNEIRRNGLRQRGVGLQMEHEHPGDLARLLAKPNLTMVDTRSGGGKVSPAVYACGDELGASFYAWRPNRSGGNGTPILIEFEASQNDAAVDGRDFLYVIFQSGDAAKSKAPLAAIFGEKVLDYADAAWAAADHNRRMALADLAIHDHEVVAAHHANQIVIGGRHQTIFKSAFTIALPIPVEQILKVWIPTSLSVLPTPQVTIDMLRP